MKIKVFKKINTSFFKLINNIAKFAGMLYYKIGFTVVLFFFLEILLFFFLERLESELITIIFIIQFPTTLAVMLKLFDLQAKK